MEFTNSKQVAAGRDEWHVRVVSRRLVKASGGQCNGAAPRATDDYVMSVSNLDLIPNTYQASVLCVYPKPATGDFAAVVAALEAGLPSLLGHFFPLAGRIARNPDSGLPEVHCRNQGAELVVGEAQVPLKSLDFQLAEASLKKMVLPYDEAVALSVQLVSFACGGFSVAWANNNLVLDGNSATRLVTAWSELARTGTIYAELVPCFDRSSALLQPRDPPCYRDAVSEMFTPFDANHLVNVLTARESFVERLYYVEARDIDRLRDTASGEQQRSSRVQAFSAYLWKALAAAVVSATSKSDVRCRMGWYVDARWRVASPDLRAGLRSYVGNVTPYVVAEAAAHTVLDKSLAEVAATVREAIASVDYDERVQELVDWVEMHMKKKTKTKDVDVVEAATVGLGSPTVSQRVWASFPIDTDFGFGGAALAVPVWASEGLCSGNVVVTARPGGDGSWIVSADLWPRLAAALEADDVRVFKPLTAEYLGI